MSSFSSSRPSRSVRRRRRRLIFFAGAALLAAASVSGKAVNYRPAADPRPEQDDARPVQEVLSGHGWSLSGSVELYPGSGAHALQFVVPGCIGIVRVGLLPATGEMAGLFALAAGPDARVFYAYQGRISAGPPRIAYLKAKAASLMEALGFRSRASSPVVAISQPQACRLEAALLWSEPGEASLP